MNRVRKAIVVLGMMWVLVGITVLICHQGVVNNKADSAAGNKYWQESDADWREKVDEYVKTINNKNLYYNSTTVAQLDINAPNRSEKAYGCPITQERKCDMRKIDDNNLIIFIPSSNEGEERWLFAYSKDDDGKLKAFVLDYNRW